MPIKVEGGRLSPALVLPSLNLRANVAWFPERRQKPAKVKALAA